MPESAKEKISMFSHVAKWFAERLSLKDVTQGIRFSSPSNDTDYLKNSNLIMQKWSDLAERLTLN